MLEALLLFLTLAVLGVGLLQARQQTSTATRLPRQPWPTSPGEDWIRVTVRCDGKPLPLLLTVHELAMAKERASRHPEVFDSTL